MITAAQKVDVCSWNATVTAFKDPGKDWYAAIRQCTGDPALSLYVAQLKAYASQGVASVGNQLMTPVVASVVLSPVQTVVFNNCVNEGTSDTIRVATGQSVKDPKQPQTMIIETQVQLYPAPNYWLVNQVTVHSDEPCTAS